MNFIKRLFTPRIESETVKVAKAILRKTKLDITNSTEPDNKLIKEIDSVYSVRFYSGVKSQYEEYSVKVNDDFTRIELILTTRKKLVEVRITQKPGLFSTLAWSEVINSKDHKELIEEVQSFSNLKEQILWKIASREQEEARQAARRVLGIPEENT